jgi:hypothetical protein
MKSINVLSALIFMSLSILVASGLMAQERTVGMVLRDSIVDDGFYLYSPKPITKTYLLNTCGELVNFWTSDFEPGNIEYFDDEGNLYIAKNIGLGENPVMSAGGQGGILERYNWDGSLDWQIQISDSTQLAHHEFRILPNGNLLVLAFDYRGFDECIQAGRDSTILINRALWSEKIIEIKPGPGNSYQVVWEWYLWDHLIQDHDSTKDNYGVVADHPELMDINYIDLAIADWSHANALDYNPELDQIILCSRNFNEFAIIDHSTTTEEAASHSGGRWGKGGDFLFRYGNPAVYGQGDTSDQMFYDPHGANWVDAGLEDEGAIMVFNNGNGRPGVQYSQVLKLFPSMDQDSNYIIEDGIYKVDEVEIIFEGEPRDSFYAALLSGAQALENGRYLVSHGPGGTFFEIDENRKQYMKYISPVDSDGNFYSQGDTNTIGGGPILGGFIFRATKYPADFPGFDGKDMSPVGYVERDPFPSICPMIPSSVQELNANDALSKVYPMPVGGERIFYIDVGEDFYQERYSISAMDGSLAAEGSFAHPHSTQRIELPGSLSNGLYMLSVHGRRNGAPSMASTMIVLF